jgi:O-antigen ligase
MQLILSMLIILVSIPIYTLVPIISKLSLQFRLVVAFILWLAFVWIPNRWFYGPIFVILEFAPVVIVYFFLIAHLRSTFRLHLFRLVVTLVTLYILFMGVSQYKIAAATHTDMPYAMVWAGDDLETAPRLRGLGVLGDPNIFGQYLLALLPLLFVSNKPRGMRMGYLFAVPTALVVLTGVYMTGSRGALLGVLVLLGLYLQSRFKKAGLIAGLCLGIGGLIGINLLGMSRGSISVAGGEDRLMIWSEGIGLLKRSPLWGLGYTSFSDNVRATAHNSYLLCAVESGVIGLFLWMGIFVITIRQLQTVSRSAVARPGEQQPGDPVLARWAEAVKKSVIVYLFTAYFLSCTYQMFLFVLIGLAGAIFCVYTEKEGRGPVLFEKWARQTLIICMAVLVLIWVSVHSRLF